MERLLLGPVLLAMALSPLAVVHGASASAVWDIFGDFGRFDGEVRNSEGGFVSESNGLRVETAEEKGVAGVAHRRTVVRNISEKPIAASCLLDVFRLGGGAFEVYTQANTWMWESRGAWQPLHTGVEVRGGGMRSSFGAAPMLAVWNVQGGHGRVFHLMSEAAWEMRASVVPDIGQKTFAVVETGMDSRHLHFILKPGEEIALPEVVWYDFKNRTDFDCHRLHAWWNASHPHRDMPSFYNTWLYRFDKLNFDFVLKQVERAGRLGLEYFVIDAGWFGPAKGWTKTRGDWKEYPDGRFGGRLSEVTDAVRAAGMKFGLWIEPEATDSGSEATKSHPELFRRIGGGYYLDFTREESRKWLLAAVDALVEKYGVEFFKFDFNDDPRVDPSGRDFADYNAGYRKFVWKVRSRHPGVYIEGCASGGLMMDLGWARDFDSFWLSDNQSPIYGLRIAKDTMLRLPPQKIERWITVRSASGLQPDYFGKDGRLFATEDPWWKNMRSLAPEYVAAFAAGGTIGFSCDLTALSDEHFDFFRKLVAERKKDAVFWRDAVGRVLCDTPEVIALQYSDAALKDVRIVAAAGHTRQSSVLVHPVLAPDMEYEYDGKRLSGAVWMAEGVSSAIDDFTAKEFRFFAKQE